MNIYIYIYTYEYMHVTNIIYDTYIIYIIMHVSISWKGKRKKKGKRWFKSEKSTG